MEYEVFAYFLLPSLFTDGQVYDLEVPEQKFNPPPKNSECLGYDAVEFRENSFGCSPLSCNGQAGEVKSKINSFCLVNDKEVAIELARRFSEFKPEPGPYGVVEVWRVTTVEM